MRFRMAVISVCTTAALVVPVTLLEASAAGRAPVSFSRVQYDSPGSDRGSNRSLNAEWIRVTNHGNKVRRLAGWTIRDRANHVYRFPRNFRLRPGRSVQIHTGSGRNTRSHLYWRQNWYVWNNDGDRAVLRSRSGARKDICRWGAGSGRKRC
jgi:hypothetical protein